MKPNLRVGLLFVCGLAMLLPSAYAGDVLTGTVFGIVLDKAGNKPLEGVEIVLVNTKTGVPSRKLTNANGEYVFDMVPPGVFEIISSAFLVTASVLCMEAASGS